MAAWTNLTTLKGELARYVAVSSQKLQPSTDQIEDAVRDALDELSSVRPETLVHEALGDTTTRLYVLPTVIGALWIADRSTVSGLQKVTDPDTDDENAEAVEDDRWITRDSVAGDRVLHLSDLIGTGASLRIFWTRPLTIDELDTATATTVRAPDTQTLLLLAAERLAQGIARAASDLADNTLGVDQVDFQTFDRRWRERARELREKAEQRLNPEGTSVATGTSVQYRTSSRLTRGQRRVAH